MGLKNRITILLCFIFKFSVGQTVNVDDLRSLGGETFHHVFDSTQTIAVDYLVLPTVSASDLSKKILIVQQHQYELKSFFRSYVKALALNYKTKEPELYALFTETPLPEYYENALLQDMHWSDITLLGHMYMYCEYGNSPMVPVMLSHALEKGNQKITALNLLKWVRNEYGLQSPCELYRSYKLYNHYPYAGDTTWLTEEEDQKLYKFYSVYKDHCEKAVYPLIAKGSWVGDVFNDEILFYREQITPATDDKKALADLVLDSIREPEYSEEINGTVFILSVSNKGKTESGLSVIKITNGFTSKNGYDMIWYEKLESIEPGETKKIVIRIPNHWVYNPNAEVEITLDKFNAVPEIREKNNSMQFFKQG